MTLFERASATVARRLGINEAHAQRIRLQLLKLQLVLDSPHSHVASRRRRHLHDNHPNSAIGQCMISDFAPSAVILSVHPIPVAYVWPRYDKRDVIHETGST